MIRLFGLSDTGLVREENQDNLLIHEPEDDAARRLRGVLVAIADGMGGLQSGEMASRLAAEVLLEKYYQLPGDAAAALCEAVQDANRVIHEYAREHGDGQPMGSTITAVAILDGYACIAQVGDSRCYLLRGNELRQITRDHSLVRELADQGKLDPDSFHYSFHRNVLTRGLGLRESVDVDLFELTELEEGDLLLVSSDGFHELVSEEEIVDEIRGGDGDLEILCKRFIELARERGGPDNITVGLALIGAPSDGRSASPDAAAPESVSVKDHPEPIAAGHRRGWFVPLAIFLSFAAGVLLTIWLQDKPAPETAKPPGDAARGEATVRGLPETPELPEERTGDDGKPVEPEEPPEKKAKR